MTALPSSSTLTASTATEGDAKTWFSNVRSYLSGLLGDDGTKATALAALQTPFCAARAKTGAYTVVADDRGKVIECSGTWTLSLTAAATLADGFAVAVANTGSGTITIDANLSELINGATTKDLTAGASVILYCDGSGWMTFGSLTSAGIAAALGYTPASTTALAARVSIDHGHGNIGSFVFAASDYLTIAAGSTESGSRLHIAGLHATSSGQPASLYAATGTLSGTWRCLGYCVSPSSGRTATLWQRIS